jgi:hypothetical protein
MKSLSDFFFKKYFQCKKEDKHYWFDMYLKAYFKEQKLK